MSYGSFPSIQELLSQHVLLISTAGKSNLKPTAAGCAWLTQAVPPSTGCVPNTGYSPNRDCALNTDYSPNIGCAPTTQATPPVQAVLPTEAVPPNTDCAPNTDCVPQDRLCPLTQTAPQHKLCFPPTQAVSPITGYNPRLNLNMGM